jgi:hypothetical protein
MTKTELLNQAPALVGQRYTKGITLMASADHLVIQYAGYTHHGIDLGDGTVIEYGGKDTGRASVRRVWRKDFVSRGACSVRQYPPGATLHPNETVRLAWARLREQKYDLFNNNCEHLAYWCKTGQHWSPQANTLKDLFKFGIVAALFAIFLKAPG